jgi:branched-chain amino acid transport system substrate-binding protein
MRSEATWATALLVSGMALLPSAGRAGGPPVYIGLDAEFGYADSTSAEAIRNGILIAVDEINAAGGVLGGRPLKLEERANHSVPARSIENVRELAAIQDLVAVYCGRFSPTVLEVLPTIHELGLPLLDPWGAADAIVENGRKPNFAFRLSLRDSWAMPAMLRHASRLKAGRVGMLLLNTSWGRGNLQVAERYVAGNPGVEIVGTHWFNWNDTTFLEKYRRLRALGAQAIILVANANEAVILLREVAALPAKERVPIISHWGVSGGRLAQLAGPYLRKVELSVVQTYSFIGAKDAVARRVVASHDRRFGTRGARTIESPVGVAHAYDLTHLLARAIDKAGSTDRRAVRDALERLGPYAGLVRFYAQPFTPSRHDALVPELVFMAEYADDGAIQRIQTPRRRPVEE